MHFSRRSVLAIASAAVLAIGLGLLQLRGESTDGRADSGELQRLLDRLVSGPDAIAPGATAFVSGPEGTWRGAAGVADLSTGRTMRPDERFRIASITKPFTATVVLQLAAEGRLQLDDTVERRLPGLLPFGSRITIRQLLNHTSGIWDSNDASLAAIARVGDAELRARLETLAARFSVDRGGEFPSHLWIELAAWQPLYFEPGTGYHYSNVGYDVLGEIVEDVTRNAFGAELERRIFAPLGLRATAYEPHAEIAGPHTRLYEADAEGGWADRTNVTGGIGAGGAIVSTAEQTARFYAALLRGDLLPPRWLAAMKKPSRIAGAAGLGLGIDSPITCGGKVYGHGGALAADRTWVFVSGDGSHVATLFLNGRGPGTDGMGSPTLSDLYCATEAQH